MSKRRVERNGDHRAGMRAMKHRWQLRDRREREAAGEDSDDKRFADALVAKVRGS